MYPLARNGSSLLAIVLVCSLLSGCVLLDGPSAPILTPTPTLGPAEPTETPTPTPTGPDTPAPTEAATPDPRPELRDVTLTFQADNATPDTYVVWFVDTPVDHVTVGYANGTERTVTIQENQLPAGTLDGAVALRPVATIEREFSHTDPDPTDGVTLTVPTAASDLFLVALTEARVIGGRAYTCGPSNVGGVAVTVQADDIATENLECRL